VNGLRPESGRDELRPGVSCPRAGALLYSPDLAPATLDHDADLKLLVVETHGGVACRGPIACPAWSCLGMCVLLSGKRQGVQFVIGLRVMQG